MFNEHRLVYLERPASDYEDETQTSLETDRRPEVSVEEFKEYTKAAAEIAIDLEGGQVADAAKTFYEAYLESPEKMKRYRDLLMMTTNPLLWLSRYLPGLGIFANKQIEVTDALIDKIFGVMNKVTDIAEDNEGVQLIKKAKGQWDSLDSEEQAIVKGMLEELSG